jgi:hypothetical protein
MMGAAREAEASSAGEQLAKEYLAETHRTDGAGAGNPLGLALATPIDSRDFPCLKNSLALVVPRFHGNGDERPRFLRPAKP